MRIHDLVKPPIDVNAVRKYAASPDQQAFVHVTPQETGLTRTIWVSQSDRYPVLLVARQTGRIVHPPPQVQVIGFEQTSDYDDVNCWLRLNHDLLEPLADQEIDIGHFYDRMVPNAVSQLAEMVNLPRRESLLPMVVRCSPRLHSADVRVKVSPIHGDRMPEDAAISIALRPLPHYPDDETKRLPKRDFELVSTWLIKNQQPILDYWDMKIDTGEFRHRIAALNQPVIE